MMKDDGQREETNAIEGDRGTEEVLSSIELNITQDSASYKVKRAQSLKARYVYGFMFFKAIILAWFVRDYGHKLLQRLLPIGACGAEGNKCLHTEGVLRVSLGCFMFFSVMSATTFGVHKLHEARNSWHSRWWPLKFIAYVFFMAATFLIPANVIQIYGEVAHVGAGIFLLLQLISLIHFLSWCNSKWMPDMQPEKCGLIGLFFSTIFYIASFFGILLMYFRYASESSCTINMFFMACTAILVKVMMIVSLHPKVNVGLLSSAIMGFYIVFLCWSAIQSEPQIEKCNTKINLADNNDAITIVSFFIAISAILTATFSTGIDSRTFQFRKVEVQSEESIPYNYSTFHFIFAMGAMYFAMLFINWELNQPTKRWRIDIGWASTWIKIVNQWFAVSIYLWKLVSSVMVKNNAIQPEESVQSVGVTV